MLIICIKLRFGLFGNVGCVLGDVWSGRGACVSIRSTFLFLSLSVYVVCVSPINNVGANLRVGVRMCVCLGGWSGDRVGGGKRPDGPAEPTAFPGRIIHGVVIFSRPPSPVFALSGKYWPR